MTNAARRLAPGSCPSPSLDGSPVPGVRTAVARWCGLIYKSNCLLPKYDVGDPIRERFSARDIPCIEIADPYNAPPGHYTNNSVDDGIGCEA